MGGSILDEVEIASPCSVDWADMQGTDRVRVCWLCKKNVFDISAMTGAEAITFLSEVEGEVCVQLYRREDGSVLTADCPVGLRERLALLRDAAKRRSRALGALISGAIALVGLSRLIPARRHPVSTHYPLPIAVHAEQPMAKRSLPVHAWGSPSLIREGGGVGPRPYLTPDAGPRPKDVLGLSELHLETAHRRNPARR